MYIEYGAPSCVPGKGKGGERSVSDKTEIIGGPSLSWDTQGTINVS